MCASFTTPEGWHEVGLSPDMTSPTAMGWKPVRPFDPAWVLRANPETGTLEEITASWSLVPPFAEEKRVKYSTFNARLDRLLQSAVWRASFPARRCLVPVGGIFERVAEAGAKKKRPYFIQFRDKSVFFLAGLWSEWVDRETGEVHLSFTVITTGPNALMDTIGHHRMPCVLAPVHQAAWLDPTVTDTDRLLGQIREPAPARLLEAWPVSHGINYRGERGRDLVERIGETVRVEA